MQRGAKAYLHFNEGPYACWKSSTCDVCKQQTKAMSIVYDAREEKKPEYSFLVFVDLWLHEISIWTRRVIWCARNRRNDHERGTYKSTCCTFSMRMLNDKRNNLVDFVFYGIFLYAKNVRYGNSSGIYTLDNDEVRRFDTISVERSPLL